MSAAIELEGLTKHYGPVHAVAGLTLRVEAGEIYGLLGPNGAGKTTTLGMLAGLLRPTAGQVSMAGIPVRPGGAHRKRFGFLPQTPAFHRWLTGRQYLEHVAEVHGLDRATRRRRAGELLEQLDLVDAARRRIGTYSGGMCQRVGLAAALVNDPDILLLDEPVSALDPIGRREMLTLIRSFAGDRTVIMSSHVLDDVDRVATSVGILDQGKLLVHAPITELRQRYTQPVYELEFDRPPPGLPERLQRIPWVQAVERSGTVLTVVVNQQETAARELPGLAAGSDGVLLRYERRTPSLEDMFVQIVAEARQ